MGLDTTHVQYDQYKSKWRRCRDAVAGQDSLQQHDASTSLRSGGAQSTQMLANAPYIPFPSRSTTAEEYRNYIMRAQYFPAPGRTVDGFLGMVFRRDPVVNNEELVSELVENIDGAGTSLQTIARQLVRDALVVSRAGVLVDYPVVNAEGAMTVQQAESMNARPRVTWYRAEDILDWREGMIGNERGLTFVKLAESEDIPDPEDEFKTVTVYYRRVLDFNEQGQYRQRLYEQANSQWQQIGEETVPRINGAPFSHIPFFIIDPVDGSADVDDPLMLDLVNVSLAYYRNSADYENALFKLNPTPYLFGLTAKEIDDMGGTLRLGANSGFVSSSTEARAGYMEFTGQGLTELREAMNVKTVQMAALGARMLLANPSRTEAAETAAIHRAGEDSILASVANSVSEVLTKALRIAAVWSGLSEDSLDELSIRLNTDYQTRLINPAMVTALVAAVQNGFVARRSLLEFLQQHEVISPDYDIDELMQELESEMSFGLGENESDADDE